MQDTASSPSILPRPLRVLFANAVGILGGGERSLLDILDTLDRDSVTPEVLLLSPGPLEEALATRGVPVHVLEAGNTGTVSRSGGAGVFGTLRAVCSAFRCAWRIASLVRRGGYDVFHSNTYKTHYLSLFVWCCTRAKVVWHLREIVRDSREGRFFRWLAKRLPHCVVCNSSATRRSLGVEEATPQFRIIANAIDCAAYAAGDRQRLRDVWGVTDADVVVLHVGMLCPLKGQHVLLDAARERMRSGATAPRVVYVFVGEAVYETADPALAGYADRLREQAMAFGLENDIIFAGELSETADAYAAADIVVSTSTRPESFGRCVVEAMAAARAVIAFDAGGPAEIIQHESTGLLVPQDDVKGVADAVNILSHDSELRRQYGAAGQAQARALYDRARLGAECRATYEVVLMAP